MKNKILFCFLMLSFTAFSQGFITPSEKNNFSKVTSHNELMEFIGQAVSLNPAIKADYSGRSVQGRVIPVLFVSHNPDNPVVYLFAQQHGNETAGKEGMLFLIKELAEGKLDNYLKKVNLLLIPSVNPDGNEVNRRRNGNNADLNRDHIKMFQPEVQLIHENYRKYKPVLCVDIHEYVGSTEEWIKFGAYKTYNIQTGVLTNYDIPEKVKSFSKGKALPFIKDRVTGAGYTFNEYTVGGPPNLARLRYSTTDINDGRTSTGLLGSLSFIIEGKREDGDSVANLKVRALSQFTAAKAFIEFAAENIDEILKLYKYSSEGLSIIDSVSIQQDHFNLTGKTSEFILTSSATGKDTLIKTDSLHENVVPLKKVKTPAGYLIPASDPLLKEWCENYGVVTSPASDAMKKAVYEMRAEEYYTRNLEEYDMVFPEVKYQKMVLSNSDEYRYIDLSKNSKLRVVLALEPESMYGLFIYEEFKYLMNKDGRYAILRVE